MGFQIPPTLPDYKKLQIILANSGVQSWNPPIFDILSRLIEAVSQSQNAFVGSAINNIVNNSINNGNIIIPGPGGVSSPIFYQRLVISNADINAGTPLTIIPGPTTGNQVIPLWLLGHTICNTNYFTTSNVTLRYANGTANLVPNTIRAAVTSTPFDRFELAITQGFFNDVTSGNDPRGQGINVIFSGFNIGGSGSLELLLAYTEATL